MSLEEHLPNGDKTPLAIELEATESYFLGIFCVESCLKASSKLLSFKVAS
jgi:voltage-dependent calcium channel N type alpha-1B